MEGRRVGQDPVDKRSGVLLEGFEWSCFSSVTSQAVNMLDRCICWHVLFVP